MNMISEIEDEASPNIFAAIPAILWQRKWLLVPPVVLGSIAGAVAAYSLPAMYESSATVLIVSQQVPDAPGASQMDAIDERIARARERVLSRQDLIRAIRANNLYPAEQQSKPLSAIVDQMRNATGIGAVGIDADGNGMRAVGGRSTIALRISYRYRDPVQAQVIAQQFVNRFLEEDAKSQADQAAGAESFLGEQARGVQAQLSAVEQQITQLKSQNGTLLSLGQQSTGDPTADAARIDAEIAGLQAQNSQLSAGPQGGADGGVAQAEQTLRVLQARFSDSHPDVIAAKEQLEAARRAAAGNRGVNPQVIANRAQMQILNSTKALMLSSSSRLREAQARAPALAGQVDQLEKKAEGLREQSRALGARLQGAQMSSRMESEQKGERMTLSDPPLVPDTPVSPNRPMLMAAGLAGGIGLGLALVMLMELLLRPIRGTEALRSVTGVAPLAIVPDFDRRPHALIRWLERRNRRKAGA